MRGISKRTFALLAVFSLLTLLMVPIGYGALASDGSRLTIAATGPTLPPPPWAGTVV